MGRGIGWTICGLLAVATAAIWLWEGNGGDAPRGAGQSRAIPVVAEAVAERDIVERLRYSGSLIAASRVDVAPRVGGRLDRLHVDIGDVISAGELLAELDDEEFQLDLAQAQAELAVARANVTEAEAALTAAERSLARTRNLREQRVASQADLDAAETEVAAEEARLQLTRSQVTQREAAVRAAEVRLGYTGLRAEGGTNAIDRLVAERHIDAGSIVQANTPVLTLVDIDPLRAVVQVPERDYGRLRPGQTVTLRADAWPGETFQGEVSRVAPVFREASRQARVEILVPNADYKLRPGMFVRSEIRVGEQERVSAVPLDAIVERDDERGMFVVEERDNGDGVARFRTVPIGARDGGWARVEGLEPGTRVVTLGQHLLTDGTSIRISEDEAVQESAR